jgi:DNA repair exonuclease SbcCD ATPase subunit
LVTYLDAERRKDKQQLSQMQERVESLSREVEARVRYSQTLENTVAELKLQLNRAVSWPGAIEQMRAEFNLVIERDQEQRVKAERELLRTRQIEIESLVRQLNEIKKELKPIGRLGEEIVARQAEEARLADLINRTQIQLMELERRFDQPTATLNYLEEQRRSDSKRIASVEQSVPDITKRFEPIQSRILMLEEAIRKKTAEIEEASRILEAQRQVIESQRVADLRRERQFAEYAEVIERLKERAETIQSQVTGFFQMRDEVRRELSPLPDFKQQLEVRINEVAEIQREAEERAKRVASAFRDEVEKQMKTFTVSQEEKWVDRDRRISSYDPRIVELEEDFIRISDLIPPLYNMFEEFSTAYAAAGREWLARSNTLLDQAKTIGAAEVKPSRRQRRRQQALARPEGAEDSDVDMNQGLI